MYPQSNAAKAYQILGVQPGDDAATVRQAWVNLVRSYHPKATGADKSAIAKHLAAIDAAFDVVDTRGAMMLREDAQAAARKQREAEAQAARSKTNRPTTQRPSRAHPQLVQSHGQKPGQDTTVSVPPRRLDIYV